MTYKNVHAVGKTGYGSWLCGNPWNQLGWQTNDSSSITCVFCRKKRKLKN